MTFDMTLSGEFTASDPLQPVDHCDGCGLGLERTSEPTHEGSVSKVEKTTVILQWTVEQVATWLQESVPFSQDRMQECLRSFQGKGVDGLGLLTLPRSHQACTGMSDFEWLLLKAARKRLLAGGSKLDPLSVEKLGTKCNLSTSFWTPPCTPRKGQLELTPPDSPQSYREMSNSSTRGAQEAFTFSSPGRMFAFPKLPWCSDAARDEQLEVLVAEVQLLRGEVLSIEERETTLQAQMQHLDEVLQTAVLAEYVYTRTRWVSLLGEPEEGPSVDDWLQRFLVLQGSSIFFYLRATDLRPQGTIPLDDIVEVGPLPAQTSQESNSQRWFYFHVTTCHGLRLECSTPFKFQMESWLTYLGVDVQSLQQKYKHTELT